jgi:hypothetical protein
MQKAYIPPGYYKDGSALIEAPGFAQDIGAKFAFNIVIGRLSLNFRSTASYDLQSIMGFVDLPDCEKLFGATGERDFDANRRLNLMCVYCDVASHSTLGDTNTPPVARLQRHGQVRGLRATHLRPVSSHFGGPTRIRYNRHCHI